MLDSCGGAGDATIGAAPADMPETTKPITAAKITAERRIGHRLRMLLTPRIHPRAAALAGVVAARIGIPAAPRRRVIGSRRRRVVGRSGIVAPVRVVRPVIRVRGGPERRSERE